MRRFGLIHLYNPSLPSHAVKYLTQKAVAMRVATPVLFALIALWTPASYAQSEPDLRQVLPFRIGDTCEQVEATLIGIREGRSDSHPEFKGASLLRSSSITCQLGKPVYRRGHPLGHEPTRADVPFVMGLQFEGNGDDRRLSNRLLVEFDRSGTAQQISLYRRWNASETTPSKAALVERLHARYGLPALTVEESRSASQTETRFAWALGLQERLRKGEVKPRFVRSTFAAYRSHRDACLRMATPKEAAGCILEFDSSASRAFRAVADAETNTLASASILTLDGRVETFSVTVSDVAAMKIVTADRAQEAERASARSRKILEEFEKKAVPKF
jgi:hypothetical protein